MTGWGLKIFTWKHFFYMRLLLQTIFFCVSVFLQTLSLFFYLHTICFSVQNFPTSPHPRQKISGPSLTNLGICRFLLAGFYCFIQVSSTKDSKLLNLMSSVNVHLRLRSIGPRIEPWGTPCIIVSGPDNEVATRVELCLF